MVLSEHETRFWKRHLALCSTVSLLGSPVCNNAAVKLLCLENPKKRFRHLL